LKGARKPAFAQQAAIIGSRRQSPVPWGSRNARAALPPALAVVYERIALGT
jgi:hypothetical protein